MKKNQRAVIYTARAAAAPPLNPNYPYRVVWNSLVSGPPAVRDQYLTVPGTPPYRSSVKATAVLTNNPPMTFVPEMQIDTDTPFRDDFMGAGSYTYSYDPGYQPMRINRIAEISNPVRTFQWAIYQTRFACKGVVKSMDLLRYNLNASGSKYFKLAVRNDAGVLKGVLSHCLNGVDEMTGVEFDLTTFTAGVLGTDIRLCISPTEIHAVTDNPGVIKGSLPLNGVPAVEAGAHLLVYSNFDLSGMPLPPQPLETDFFVIWEGTFA